MNGLKKSGVSLIALALSTSIAPSIEASYKNSNTRQHGGAYIGVEGFYAEGFDSFLDTLPYALSTPTIPPLSVVTPPVFIPHDFQYFYNHPEENWGYQITIGYDMPSCDPCCNYGLLASYTNFESDQSNQTPEFTYPPGTDFPGEPSFTLVTPFASANLRAVFPIITGGITTSINSFPLFSRASSHFDKDYKTADFVGYVNRSFCHCVEIQAYGGARYLYVNEDIHVNASFTPGPLLIAAITAAGGSIASFDEQVFTDSKFSGAGPRVGCSAYYPFPFIHNLGVVADVSGNLLYGTSSCNYRESTTVAPVVPTEITPYVLTTHNHEKHKSVVTSLGGKAALALNFDFRNCSHLTLEAGYRADKYFQSMNNSALISSALRENVFISHKYNQFDLGGPYISATFHI